MIFFETILSFLKNKEYRTLLLTTVFVIAIGTGVYQYLENWTWLDSLYFSIITLTTIGYGDFSPQTVAGKWFTIFYIILGVGIILTFINTVYKHFSPSKKDKDNHME
tara:strand:+ start:144 stop:464 length:321 start_codon:yes stop_codon:yes gene_type:complete